MKSVDGKGAASFLYNNGNVWAVKNMRGLHFILL